VIPPNACAADGNVKIAKRQIACIILKGRMVCLLLGSGTYLDRETAARCDTVKTAVQLHACALLYGRSGCAARRDQRLAYARFSTAAKSKQGETIAFGQNPAIQEALSLELTASEHSFAARPVYPQTHLDAAEQATVRAR
jgi:hypothetical protein